MVMSGTTRVDRDIDAAVARVSHAMRIREEWDTDGDSSSVANLSQHRLAVVIRAADNGPARVLHADTAADVAMIEAACRREQYRDPEGVEAVYEIATGEQLRWSSTIDVRVEVQLDGEHGAYMSGASGRVSVLHLVAQDGAEACEELATELVRRSHTEANCRRADRLHKLAAALRGETADFTPIQGVLVTAEQWDAAETFLQTNPATNRRSVELRGGDGGPLCVWDGDEAAVIDTRGYIVKASRGQTPDFNGLRGVAMTPAQWAAVAAFVSTDPGIEPAPFEVRGGHGGPVYVCQQDEATTVDVNGASVLSA
jgi:hypothetical protein